MRTAYSRTPRARFVRYLTSNAGDLVLCCLLGLACIGLTFFAIELHSARYARAELPAAFVHITPALAIRG